MTIVKPKEVHFARLINAAFTYNGLRLQEQFSLFVYTLRRIPRTRPREVLMHRGFETWYRDLIACVNARGAEFFVVHVVGSKMVEC